MNHTLIRTSQTKMNELVNNADGIVSLISNSDFSQDEINKLLLIAEHSIKQANDCFDFIKNEFKNELNIQLKNGN